MTTCTHTDQPLTMIKPKGRPATQCQHCREQRKNKHLHTQCTCGKKGKSPGMHLALCQCHKNSHCTCASNASKKGSDTKKKLQKSVSELSIRKEAEAGKVPGDTGVATKNTIGMIEDVPGFEMGNGLFDMFSPSSDNFSSALMVEGATSGINESGTKGQASLSASGSVESPHGFSMLSTNNNTITNNDNNNEISDRNSGDIMDKMFPLFPLVGNSSFSNNKNQPMSPLPENFRTKLDQVTGQPPLQPENGENFNTAALPYQQIRPTRPESSLSIASTSSTASKSNNNMNNFNYQNIPLSSAYPPNNVAFSDESNNQDGQFTDSLFNNYESRPHQYEQVVNPVGSQDNISNNNSGLGFDKTKTQSSRNLDLDLHPMFSELLLPMSYDSQNEK